MDLTNTDVTLYYELIDTGLEFDLGLTAKRRFPVLLGDIVTTNESDPVFLRYRNLTPSTVELFLQEEQSLDDETAHVTEDVSIFAAE